MKTQLFFPAILFLACSVQSIAQPAGNPGENLVQNPSFEELSEGATLERSNLLGTAAYWTSPNSAEPLLFTTIGNHIYDPNGSSWPFKARTGKNVAGMNVYGGTTLTPRREYIQGTLKTPLSQGKMYYFSFYVHYHCEGANNIGIVFLPNKVETDGTGRLNLEPVSYQKSVTPYNNTDRTWTLVRDSFIAVKPFQSFIIGNFFTNEETEVESARYGHYFAYIDDIEVVEAASNPLMTSKTPSKEEEKKWTTNVERASNPNKLQEGTSEPEANDVVVVLFRFDASAILSEYKPALDEIVQQLQQDPEKKATITGYASNEGPEAYNKSLSTRRARAVQRYLSRQGIASERIDLEGKGIENPVESNDTPEGRKKNRRVEIRIE